MIKGSPVQFSEAKTIDRYIIAIGASAGGLEAIHEFFDHMPANSGFTFIVIQHLSPDYKSLLVELVSKHTHMKVFEAANDVTLQRDCVYIIPNKKLMTIKGNKLKLADKIKDKSPNTAIDTFLFTLAKDKKDKAIAIILSGTGTDGTKGVEAIKECGGMVIVQEPTSAKFDGMPNSAITSGNADYILPPARMYEEVYNYVNQNESHFLEDKKIDETLLDKIFKMVHNSSGHDFNLYKTPTILRRIARRMAALEIKELKDYVTVLEGNAAEVKTLSSDFLIGVTKFFRDKQAFDIIAKDIIPNIVKGKIDGDMLKVWVCACSTGEEAYSIAILINDYIISAGKDLEVKIFATDIDEASIEIASKNNYPHTIEKEINPILLKKYFIKDSSGYSVIPSIRKQIVFARHNVMKSPPFIKNDLITCRNMLIYMNNLLQQKIITTFHYALNKNAYLFLGSSENAGSIKEGVTEISSKWKIYQKTGNVNFGLHHTYTAFTPSLKTPEKKQPVKPAEAAKSLEDEFKDLVVEEFGPVAVFIDKSYIIKETIGNYRQYLTLPEKKPDLNILNMLSREVSVVLNTGIRKAWKENKKVRLHRLRIKQQKEDVFLQVTVRPPDERSVNDYTLLLFSETRVDIPTGKDGVMLPPSGGGPHEEYLMEMEAELSETRSNLQMAVEEMETTNEELQSSNEELLSANEELQSGNEELQSLNEELHTLNTEHQSKIKELVELNDDLDNYFRSTDIGQVFIDSNLRIRKFNPAAIKLINLIEADIGRPINHISNNIRYDNLISDIHTVLANGSMIEKEIQIKSGSNNLMRIMPYVRKDKKNDGVVISFVDISRITDLNNIISGVFNASPSAILAFKEVRNSDHKTIDFKCITWNNAALDLLNRTEQEMEKKLSITQFLELTGIGSIDKLVKVVENDKPLNTEIKIKDFMWFHVVVVKMNDGLIMALTNVTERKIAEQKLKKNYNELISAREDLKNLNHQLEDKVQERTQKLTESEERFNLVAKATNDTIWDWNMVNNTMWRSDNFTTMFGYQVSEENSNVNFWFEHIHPDDRERVKSGVYDAINNHDKQWSAEYRFLKTDGSYAIILDRGSILEDEFKTPYRMVGSIVDITRLIETEKQLSVSERRFRKIFESNLIGMVFSDMNGGILEANDPFLKMLDYTRGDVSFKPLHWDDITAPQNKSINKRIVEQLNEKKVSPPMENQFVKKSGEIVSVLMGAALLDQESERGTVAYIIDITRQKEAEQRKNELQTLVKKQQDEFYSIFTNAPALISIRRGTDRVYEFVNKAFIQFDGGNDYIGKTTYEIDPQFEGTELDNIEKQVLATGEPYTANAFQVNRKDRNTGNIINNWFDFIFIPIFSENDKVDGIAFFGFEVSDLVRGREATEDLMKKKDEFMSIASHELKTPITSLKGSLQILDRLIGRKDIDKLYQFVEKANKQTGKITTLVDDLLDVTRIQEGKMLLNIAPFNVYNMIDEAVDEVQTQTADHKIIFTGESKIEVKGDKARLEQVINNFLTNAIKYSPGADKVMISCIKDGKNVKVSVEDFGIGIPADKQKFLFDRFYRVQESSTHFSGLGLGLYISAEIIKRHSGQIGVDAKQNGGSIFWFTLPLSI